MKPNILVVDDDPHARDLMLRLYRERGQVIQAENADDAIQKAKTMPSVDLVLTDMSMPSTGDGLKVLEGIHSIDADTPVIVITAYGNIEGALDSIQRGAFDYVQKPFDVDALLRLSLRALEQRRLVLENKSLKRLTKDEPLVGKSPAIVEVYKQVARAAAANVPVLITGETGSGKEMVARELHQRSPRSNGPFVPIDCGAIAESLMESEFFGHVKGAFTGATATRRGVFEEAHHGTLFLDEIGDIGPKIQSQLLRAIQEGEIRRVGESVAVKVDVRIVAATNKDLPLAVKEGRFREDLLYRLDVVRLHVPSLRDRRDDIPLLVQHFAQRHGRTQLMPTVTDDAMKKLMSYDWPGNVRQLENVVARAMAMNTTGVLTSLDFPSPIGDSVSSTPNLMQDLPTLSELSRRYAVQVLQQAEGNKSEAARILGVDRKTLYRLLGTLSEPTEE